MQQCQPTCGFSWADDRDDEWIVVETAGNWRGCEQHRTVRHTLPLTEAGVVQLPRVLAEVEEHARLLDAEPFVKCIGDGLCAVEVGRRAAERDRILECQKALVRVYEEDLTEQQRADLHA
jgi:hypothetical protein